MAMVLASRGDTEEAVRLLRGFLDANPDSENSYLMLAKIFLATNRRDEGLAVLDRLLKKNPNHAAARELARQFR